MAGHTSSRTCFAYELISMFNRARASVASLPTNSKSSVESSRCRDVHYMFGRSVSSSSFHHDRMIRISPCPKRIMDLASILKLHSSPLLSETCAWPRRPTRAQLRRCLCIVYLTTSSEKYITTFTEHSELRLRSDFNLSQFRRVMLAVLRRPGNDHVRSYATFSSRVTNVSL
jgi:hypothetical protein